MFCVNLTTENQILLKCHNWIYDLIAATVHLFSYIFPRLIIYFTYFYSSRFPFQMPTAVLNIWSKLETNALFHTQAQHFLSQLLNKHLIKKWLLSSGSNNMRMGLSDSGPVYKILTALESHKSSSVRWQCTFITAMLIVTGIFLHTDMQINLKAVKYINISCYENLITINLYKLYVFISVCTETNLAAEYNF